MTTMPNPIGSKRWAIAEGYIPGWSHGPEPAMTSHETACLLNVSDQDAHVEITAHNHGFAVDAPLDGITDTEFGGVEVSHVCLNDDVVEGLRARDRRAFSVQYHPEAAAGPHDAAYLFDRFVDLLEGPA